jgi:hypothetical protein
MATFASLPVELLFIISYRVNAKGLCALALTCRRLRPVAQEVLHLSVRLANYRSIRSGELQYDPEQHVRLYQFARTLLERPDLGAKVRDLSLRTGPNTSTLLRTWDGRRTHAAAVAMINDIPTTNGGYAYVPILDASAGAQVAHPWDTCAAQWCQALTGSEGAAWAGFILAMTPNLEKLNCDVEIPMDEEAFSRWCFVGPRDAAQPGHLRTLLFGTGPAFDQAFIPSLRSPYLRISMGHESWVVRTLPNSKSSPDKEPLRDPFS